MRLFARSNEFLLTIDTTSDLPYVRYCQQGRPATSWLSYSAFLYKSNLKRRLKRNFTL